VAWQGVGNPKVFVASTHNAPRTRRARRAGPTRNERGRQRGGRLSSVCGGIPVRGKRCGGQEVALVEPVWLGSR
jgi:hypothetical protein